ncbi:MAG TPA: DUF4136 domain-containing protein [Bacteroidales bacterium]
MKKIILNFLVIFLIPTSIILIEGCYPNNDITIEDSDVVLTTYNDSINFKSLSTYYMPDTVLPIVDPDDPEDYENPYQSIMLSTVASNMAAYGYQRITDTTSLPKPDVAVVISVMTTTTVNAGWYYPPYWGWGYWGWYYPYYPPTAYYTSYTTGTVVISMFNPEDYTIQGSDTITTQYWDAAVNGILQSSTTNMQQRITAAIDQAFEQTPQIKTN